MSDSVSDNLSNAARLAALRRAILLDTDNSVPIDRLIRLATRILNAPIAILSVFDQDRQVLVSQIGLPEPWASRREIPLSHSFCKLTVAAGKPLSIDDTSLDALVDDNQAIIDPGIRSYAGVPLMTSGSLTPGSLCVMDHVPRHWTQHELEVLGDLAEVVMTEIELRGEVIERKWAEQEAQAVTERYRALFVNTHDGIFLIDPATMTHVEVNERAAAMLGYTPAELVGMSTRHVVASSDYEQSMTIREALLAGSDIPPYERIFRKRSGEEFPVEINVSLIRDREGTPLYFQSAVRDISKRKQAEKAVEQLLMQLSSQTATLTSVLESMADGVIVADSEGNIQMYNAAAEAMLGTEIVNMPLEQWSQHYHPMHADGVTPFASEDLPLARSLRGESSDGVEIFVRRPGLEGGLFTSRSARPIRDSSGQIIGGVLVMHDITHRKENEEIIQRQAEALAAANAELEAYGHTIAHDLKSPLNIMRGYAILLHEMDAGLSEESRQMLQAIDRAVTQMSRMIESLLLLARVRHGEEPVEVVDMAPVIQAALERFQQPLNERGFVVQVDDSFSPAMGYGPWIEEVFANFIGNAIKYMAADRPDPRISIRGIAQGEVARYEVTDNGLGIKPADQRRLFEMFSRFHSGHASGSGLGLSIAARIITRLGGEVGVESEPGQGSTFWFTLPAPAPAVR